MVILIFPDGLSALLIVLIFSLLTIFFIRKYSDDKRFLTNVFLSALCLRILFGVFIQSFDLIDFFGGDAKAYDEWGYRIVQLWYGLADPSDEVSLRATNLNSTGWGLNYLVAIVYLIFGHKIFVAQSLCAVIGAAISPMVYFCAQKLYNNQRVARFSALFIAFFPTFIVWSAQLLKDGLIVFLLVLGITMVLVLQKKASFLAIVCLIFSIIGVFSMRFYIFYMLIVAVFASLIIGTDFTVKSFIKGIFASMIIGLSLTYVGVTKTATETFDKNADIERLQAARQHSSKEYNSGFGEDFNVSSAEGAISALPIGLAYLLFAPFPWEVNNFRQAITLPEVLVWWSLLPFLISGVLYTLKNRLRSSVPIIIFTSMLTVAYALFQSNVGTAYRQRTQIQVFLFIFIAVGCSLILEKKEIQTYLKRKKIQALSNF